MPVDTTNNPQLAQWLTAGVAAAAILVSLFFAIRAGHHRRRARKAQNLALLREQSPLDSEVSSGEETPGDGSEE